MGLYAGSGEGSMRLEAAGAILKIAGDAAGGSDDDSDASKDGRTGIEGDTGDGNGNYGESGTRGPDG